MNNTPNPEDWVFNPVVMNELNQLYESFMSNTHQDNPSLDDWECRVAEAMAKTPPFSPPSWLGCHDIITHLNRLYRHLHPTHFPNNSPSEVEIDDWECHVGDAMYDWAGMTKFLNLHQTPVTPPQTPNKRQRECPPAPKKKKVSKKRRTNR